jgi:DNA-directed RNA polymerase specialized sigma subunit, sigma24 homolog
MGREDDSDVIAEQKRKEFHKKAPAYWDMLFAIVFSLTKDCELAHEVAQQTMVQYLRRMEKEHWQLEIENEGAYLVRIAKNLVNDGWRANGKAEFMSLDEQLDDRLLKVLSQLCETSNIENQIYFAELLSKMPSKTIFGGLNEYERNLFHLQVEGLSNEAIAQEVSKDTSIVRYELQKINYKIRARVRKIYGKRGLFI